MVAGAVLSCLLRICESRAGLMAQAHGRACCFYVVAKAWQKRFSGGRYSYAAQVLPRTWCRELGVCQRGKEIGGRGEKAGQGLGCAPAWAGPLCGVAVFSSLGFCCSFGRHGNLSHAVPSTWVKRRNVAATVTLKECCRGTEFDIRRGNK